MAGAGCFGASLMLEPELVAACCTAMAAVTTIPITVKCRLGASCELLRRSGIRTWFQGFRVLMLSNPPMLTWSVTKRSLNFISTDNSMCRLPQA